MLVALHGSIKIQLLTNCQWPTLFYQQPKQESPSVIIEIPDILKSRLEDDYTAVSIRGKVNWHRCWRSVAGWCCLALFSVGRSFWSGVSVVGLETQLFHFHHTPLPLVWQKLQCCLFGKMEDNLQIKINSPVKFNSYFTDLYVALGDYARCALPACYRAVCLPPGRMYSHRSFRLIEFVAGIQWRKSVDIIIA